MRLVTKHKEILFVLVNVSRRRTTDTHEDDEGNDTETENSLSPQNAVPHSMPVLHQEKKRRSKATLALKRSRV